MKLGKNINKHLEYLDITFILQLTSIEIYRLLHPTFQNFTNIDKMLKHNIPLKKEREKKKEIVQSMFFDHMD